MSAYKDEVRKTWYVKFRYTDHNGESRFTTKRGFKTKAEAVRYEVEFKSKESQNDLLFDILVDEFLKFKSTRLKEQTMHTLTCNVSSLDSFMGKKLSKITPNLIRVWQDKMIAKGMKPISVNEHRAFLHNILQFAVKYYALPSNPVDKVEKLTQSPVERRIWDERAFLVFLSYLPDWAEKYIPILKLLFYSGIRAGEAFGITREDVGDGYVTINKSFGTKISHMYTTKTRSSVRKVAIPHRVVECINEYIEKYNPKHRVFEMITYAMLSKVIRRFSVESGMGKQTLHGLRHSHISFLLAENVSITAVSAHAGHSTPAITMRVYAHAFKNSEDEIADCWSKNGH